MDTEMKMSERFDKAEADLLKGEFAKDDNINAQFDQAVENIKAVWWEVDVERLQSLAEPLLQVISDRTQGETLEDFNHKLPF